MKISDDYLAIIEDMFTEHDMIAKYIYRPPLDKDYIGGSLEFHVLSINKKISVDNSFELIETNQFVAHSAEDLIEQVTEWLKNKQLTPS